MASSADCSLDDLAALVEDRLKPTRRQDVIQHLDHCGDCRVQLDDLTASRVAWTLAEEALAEAGAESFDELSVGPAASAVEFANHPTLDSEVPDSEVPDSEVLDGSFDGMDSDGMARSGIAGSFDPIPILKLLSASDDPRSAGRIGAFEIVGIVGSGGMGIVLKARDPALDRFVAIKMLAPHLASSASARRRFAREARAAAAVLHENVIEIYQVSHWNDLPYLVMPYLPDPSLGQRIEEEGPLPLESILSVGAQVAKGLFAAHSQGLVHRDVKPANILLCKGTERAIITDFGLARATDDASLTRAGVLTGTPHFMSPEQARGKVVDQRSDLFSLGSVLFAMATGVPPVDLELGSETIERIASEAMPSLDSVSEMEYPIWLVALIRWLHQPDPAQRPGSVHEVARIMEQCLAHCRQPNKTPVPKELLRQPAGEWWGSTKLSRAAMTWTAVGGILAALGVALGLNPSASRTGVHDGEVSANETLTLEETETNAVPVPGDSVNTLEEHLSGTDLFLEWNELDVQFEEVWRDVKSLAKDLDPGLESNP